MQSTPEQCNTVIQKGKFMKNKFAPCTFSANKLRLINEMVGEPKDMGQKFY